MGVNGGVTSLLSAGEVHLPGRPKDAPSFRRAGHDGAALLPELQARRPTPRVLAGRAFARARPSAAKVLRAASPPPASGHIRRESGSHRGQGRAGDRVVPQLGLESIIALRAALDRRLAFRRPRRRSGGPARRGEATSTAGSTSIAQWPMCASSARRRPAASRSCNNCNEKALPLACLEAVRAARAPRRHALIGTDAPAGSGVAATQLACCAIGHPAREPRLPAGGAGRSCLATGNVASKRRARGRGPARAGACADIVFLGSARRRLLRADVLAPWRPATSPASAWVMIDGTSARGASRSTPAGRPRCRSYRSATRDEETSMPANIRKIVVVVEETRREMGPRDRAPDPPRGRRFPIIGTPRRPLSVEDLEALIAIGEELGDLLGYRARGRGRLGVRRPAAIESYGKAAMWLGARTAGEPLEHAAAIPSIPRLRPSHLFRAAVGERRGRWCLVLERRWAAPASPSTSRWAYKDRGLRVRSQLSTGMEVPDQRRRRARTRSWSAIAVTR